MYAVRRWLQDALAAWIPIIFEIAGCLLVLFLKLWYEHTTAGRRYSAAKQQQLQELTLPVFDTTTAAAASCNDPTMQGPQQQAGLGRGSGSQRLAAFGQAAAAAVSNSGDISWRGRAVLGSAQEAPAGLTVPMIDCSVHGGSRHGGSRHGGSWHGGVEGPAGVYQHKQGQQQSQQSLGAHQQAGDLKGAAAVGVGVAEAAAAAQQAAAL
jgi:hypothetical protein